MTEEANGLICTINQMKASLDESQRRSGSIEHVTEVYYPLRECIAELKESHNTISEEHRERAQQVKSRLSTIQDT